MQNNSTTTWPNQLSLKRAIAFLFSFQLLAGIIFAILLTFFESFQLIPQSKAITSSVGFASIYAGSCLYGFLEAKLYSELLEKKSRKISLLTALLYVGLIILGFCLYQILFTDEALNLPFGILIILFFYLLLIILSICQKVN